jgi:pyrroloquinoline quinone (PQQ) biosynthesis protein C
LKQLALFVRHRRDCWAYVSGNCPELAVKQGILQHEYGEVLRGQYSENGHMELIFRQGESIGLAPEDILCAEPIPMTMATLYSWAWITREKSWIEGLAALTVTEWSNDDRLLADQGGGHATRMAKRWKEDLGLSLDNMDDFKAHAEADEEHSDMFLPFLSRFAVGKKEAVALRAVNESLDLLAIYRNGVAQAMKTLS